MMIPLLLIALLLCPSPLPALEYGLFAKHRGGPVKRIAILSERCSGSNFVANLVFSNFENLTHDESIHKHFPPWVWQAKKTNSILYIVIFRNPYDWIRSFHRIPHHADRSLCKIPFSQFVRSKWSLNARDPIIMQLGDPTVDRNPRTGLPFKNVMELRTEKIKTMLKIRRSVNNIYYINYETARDYPREVLQEIQKIYSLTATPTYQPVVHYKAVPGAEIYSQRKYPSIPREDLHHINAHLNNRIEKRIGYRLISDPENIP